MKYNVYIKDEYLVFEDKHKNTTSIPVDEISEFTLTKVYGQITVPVKIGKAFFLHTHKLPNERGSIVIGFKKGDQKTIQKSKYRKVFIQDKSDGQASVRWLLLCREHRASVCGESV